MLFSELAPWPSLVQRFGRCNRQGELNDAGGAEIRWIDAAVEEASDLALPYMPEDLIAARNIVAGLEYAAPRELPAADRGPQPGHGLRRKDFEELFDTDPDLSGYDIDISPYVRDATDSDVQLFWRAGIDPDPKAAPPPSLSLDQPPHRDEFCRAPIGQITAWLKKPRLRRLAAYVEDPNATDCGWRRLDLAHVRIRPGLVILLDAAAGGYDRDLGLTFDATGPVPDMRAGVSAVSGDAQETAPGAVTDDDPLSYVKNREVPLELHLDDVAQEARTITWQLPHLDEELAAAVIRRQRGTIWARRISSSRHASATAMEQAACLPRARAIIRQPAGPISVTSWRRHWPSCNSTMANPTPIWSPI